MRVFMPRLNCANMAFPLKSYIMKLYPHRGLTTKQKVYNYRQSRARITIENAFGILASRFQIMKKPIPFLPDKVDLFELTTCVLHNHLLADIRNRWINKKTDQSINTNGLDMLVTNTANDSSSESREIRNEISEYCVNEGDLEWQYSKI